MNAYKIMSFYQFVPLSDFQLMKEPLLETMISTNIKGTIILASEGINGSFCGRQEDVESLVLSLRRFPELEDLVFNTTYSDFNPFAKAKVKLRKEIVTMGVSGVDPNMLTGTHLDPEEWNRLISEPDVILIDTRNDYEVKLGTFRHAINPETENFRDFPAYVEEHLIDKKDKKIAMFCTGGIRCEKSTAYLKTRGFQQVYQLGGGILNYLESMDESKSLWEGGCFVFDNRVAVDKNLKAYDPGTIDLEWKNKHRNKIAS